MAKQVGIVIRNFDQSMRTFKRLKGGKQRQALRAGVKAAASLQAKEAKRSTPERTKQLKRSIGWKDKTFSATNTVIGIIGVRRGFATTIKGKRVNPAKYLHLVELGTRHSKARHFLREAARATRKQATQAFRNKFHDKLIAIARKI